jgi:threonine dehydratase
MDRQVNTRLSEVLSFAQQDVRRASARIAQGYNRTCLWNSDTMSYELATLVSFLSDHGDQT